MPITRHDLREHSILHTASLWSRIVFRPANDPAGIGNVADPSTISVGDDLIATLNGGVPFAILGHGINLTYTDAALADFGGIIRIVGQNHLGVRTEETFVVQPNIIANSGRAWHLIEHIYVESWTNAQAADNLDVGWNTTGSANSTRFRLGLPWDYRNGDDYHALIRWNPLADGGDHVTPGQVNAARDTFTVSADDGATDLRAYRFVMNRAAPQL